MTTWVNQAQGTLKHILIELRECIKFTIDLIIVFLCHGCGEKGDAAQVTFKKLYSSGSNYTCAKWRNLLQSNEPLYQVYDA